MQRLAGQVGHGELHLLRRVAGELLLTAASSGAPQDVALLAPARAACHPRRVRAETRLVAVTSDARCVTGVGCPVQRRRLVDVTVSGAAPPRSSTAAFGLAGERRDGGVVPSPAMWLTSAWHSRSPRTHSLWPCCAAAWRSDAPEKSVLDGETFDEVTRAASVVISPLVAALSVSRGHRGSHVLLVDLRPCLSSAFRPPREG